VLAVCRGGEDERARPLIWGVSSREIPISAKDLCISLEEIGISFPDVCISAREICISLFDLPISSGDLCNYAFQRYGGKKRIRCG